MPYDQFLIQQIAADRLATGSDNSSLAAMGFLTLGRRFLEQSGAGHHQRPDRRMSAGERMALTVACARCHDHKFDPIPTADYYSLYAIFKNSPDDKIRRCLLGWHKARRRRRTWRNRQAAGRRPDDIKRAAKIAPRQG